MTLPVQNKQFRKLFMELLFRNKNIFEAVRKGQKNELDKYFHRNLFGAEKIKNHEYNSEISIYISMKKENDLQRIIFSNILQSLGYYNIYFQNSNDTTVFYDYILCFDERKITDIKNLRNLIKGNGKIYVICYNINRNNIDNIE